MSRRLLKNAKKGRRAMSFDMLSVIFLPVDRSLKGAVDRVRNANDSYLVDPASSHMLVSKTKPCMSKYKSILYLKLRKAH
jgi:hypothetical protein